MRHQDETTRDHATLCEDCGRPIPAGDIRAYQLEAGDDSLPRCCDDCAEERA